MQRPLVWRKENLYPKIVHNYDDPPISFVPKNCIVKCDHALGIVLKIIHTLAGG